MKILELSSYCLEMLHKRKNMKLVDVFIQTKHTRTEVQKTVTTHNQPPLNSKKIATYTEIQSYKKNIAN